MDCKFAYIKKKIPYVLCLKETEPDGYDRKALFSAMCPHQEYCHKLDCHKLTPEWVGCLKLRENVQNGAEVAFVADASEDAPATKTRQKRRRKAAEETQEAVEE